MFSILAALWGSKPLRWAASALIAIGAYKTWEYRVQAVGAAKVTAKIEKKARTNVKNANAVRDAAGTGAGGVRHPYTRP